MYILDFKIRFRANENSTTDKEITLHTLGPIQSLAILKLFLDPSGIIDKYRVKEHYEKLKIMRKRQSE